MGGFYTHCSIERGGLIQIVGQAGGFYAHIQGKIGGFYMHRVDRRVSTHQRRTRVPADRDTGRCVLHCRAHFLQNTSESRVTLKGGLIHMGKIGGFNTHAGVR
jgi:hypothetical protein